MTGTSMLELHTGGESRRTQKCIAALPWIGNRVPHKCPQLVIAQVFFFQVEVQAHDARSAQVTGKKADGDSTIAHTGVCMWIL